MFGKALLIALWAGIAGIDLFNGLTHIHRPLVSGMVVGLILGDLQKGLITGATLELVWMGAVPLAGAQPPNVVIGGIIGTSLAIIANLEPKAAVGFAVPFAVAVQAAITLIFTAFSAVMHRADEYAEKADTKGIERINYLGMLTLFIFYAIIAFLPVYIGADRAIPIVESIPEVIIGGLEVAGGMMPAMGFAMLLNVMLKREYIAYFIGGFILVAYFELPILGVSLIAAAFALNDYFNRQNMIKNKPSSTNSSETEDEPIGGGRRLGGRTDGI